MERENRSNGNQEESKEGRKEETLRAFTKVQPGDAKSVPLSFCAANSGWLISYQGELCKGVFPWRDTSCGRRRRCSRSRAWHRITRRQFYARPLQLFVCIPATGFRCAA